MTKLKATHGVFRFVVRGSGEFPFDMLRYDSCCFNTEMDTSVAVNGRGLREVELRRFVETPDDPRRAVTSGRWRSFAWTIISVEGEIYHG